MTIAVANVVQSTDSFGQWLAKTNQLIDVVSNYAVTVNSNTAVGDASITGSFSASSFTVPDTGSYSIGNGSSNSTINAIAVTFASSPTVNTIISTSGMIINGTTLYTSQLVAMGNTTITGGNVSSNVATFTDSLSVGNSTLTSNTLSVNNANFTILVTSGSASIGDIEANTYSDRNGLQIFADPSGYQVVNSRMTATDLWIQTIHANNIQITGSANTVFPGNTEFMGSNNYFDNGFTANGDVYFLGNTHFKGLNDTFGGSLVTFNANTLFNGVNNTFNNLTVLNNTAVNNLSVTGIFKTPKIIIGGTNNITFQPPTLAASYTLTMPENTGLNQQYLGTNGSGNLGWYNIADTINGHDIEVNSLGAGTPASGVTGEIRARGNITAYYSSDRTLKTNIENIPDALNKVMAINGVTFDWTDAYIEAAGGSDDYFLRQRDAGVIAQEIEAVLPEVVATRDDGTKAVRYEKIVALLIEAIKDLKAEVDSLKNGH